MRPPRTSLHWITVVLVLLLTLFSSSLIDLSRAQPVDIVVRQTSVRMNMNLVLAENLTDLPSFNIYLTQSNSSSIFQPISTAFQKLVPSANIANLELRARTSNSTGIWLLAENYSITLEGVSTNVGSNIRSNISLVMMNVSQSLIVSNQENHLLRRFQHTRNHHASPHRSLASDPNHHISIGQKTHRRTAPEKEKKIASPSQSDSRKNLRPSKADDHSELFGRQLGVEMTSNVVALLNFDQRGLLHDASLMSIRTPRMESAS